MAETLSLLSIVAFVVAGVCLVLAVFFWFFFHIPTVIGDLSGRTARKSIAKLRAANEKTGNKSHKESKVNVARGKLTESIPDPTPTEKRAKGSTETGVLIDPTVKAPAPISEETVSLDGNATVPLDSVLPVRPAQVQGVKLEMLEEVILIHTNEVIQ